MQTSRIGEFDAADSRYDGLKKRQSIGFVIAERQVDRRRRASKRPADDSRRQQVAGIERHQSNAAGRGDQLPFNFRRRWTAGVGWRLPLKAKHLRDFAGSSQYFQWDWDARKTAGTFQLAHSKQRDSAAAGHKLLGASFAQHDVHFAPKRWPPRHLSGSA